MLTGISGSYTVPRASIINSFKLLFSSGSLFSNSRHSYKQSQKINICKSFINYYTLLNILFTFNNPSARTSKSCILLYIPIDALAVVESLYLSIVG